MFLELLDIKIQIRMQSTIFIQARLHFFLLSLLFVLHHELLTIATIAAIIVSLFLIILRWMLLVRSLRGQVHDPATIERPPNPIANI